MILVEQESWEDKEQEKGIFGKGNSVYKGTGV